MRDEISGEKVKRQYTEPSRLAALIVATLLNGPTTPNELLHAINYPATNIVQMAKYFLHLYDLGAVYVVRWVTPDRSRYTVPVLAMQSAPFANESAKPPRGTVVPEIYKEMT